MYYVYILKSLKTGRTYTGSTDDLNRRLEEHNSGQGMYTKPYAPFEVIYSELCATRSEAVRREKYFKTGKGRENLKNIMGSL